MRLSVVEHSAKEPKGTDDGDFDLLKRVDRF
jgi:hypothetical protein